MTLTEAEIKAIDERADQATPGPWVNQPSGVVQKKGGNGPIIFWDDEAKGDRINYDFIAHSRADIPALIETVRELQGEKAKLVADVKRLRDELECGGCVRDRCKDHPYED